MLLGRRAGASNQAVEPVQRLGERIEAYYTRISGTRSPQSLRAMFCTARRAGE